VAISGSIAAVATVGSMIVGNQQKQKAKGQAAQIERDAQAAQEAADKKARQIHDENVLAQSQAGAVARTAMEGTQARPSTLISPDLNPRTLSASSNPIPTPLAPIQRKTLLGQ
jgi:hypothetical protein